MLPEPRFDVGMYVGVRPKGDPPIPSRLCWGFFVKRIAGDRAVVRIGAESGDIIDVALSQLIPCLKTDGNFRNRDPQHFFNDFELELATELLMQLLQRQGYVKRDRTSPTISPPDGWKTPISIGILALLLPGINTNPKKPCLGIITGKLGDGCMAQVSPSKDKPDVNILVRFEQIVPIIGTGGVFSGPREAVHKLRSYYGLIDAFTALDGPDILEQAASMVSNSEFVLDENIGLNIIE